MAELTEDDFDEDYESGPSLAMPPLYVLRTADRCPECGEAMHVYTLGSAEFLDSREGEPTRVFHFLRLIESLPPEVMALLADKCPSYHFDSDDTHPRPYLMNHCRCSAKLDDDYVAGDIGAALWPDTPAGYNAIQPFLLPVDDPVPVVSSYSIGGDEFMNFNNAELW